MILHPSLDKDQLYNCILNVPKDVPVNSDLGFTLVLYDRQEKNVGVIKLAQGSIDNNRTLEFRLNRELVKNSYVVFQVNPNRDGTAFVKAYPSREQTVRKVDGRIVREPIE